MNTFGQFDRELAENENEYSRYYSYTVGNHRIALQFDDYIENCDDEIELCFDEWLMQH